MRENAPKPRLEWDAIKDRISIEAVAVELLGPPQGRGGSRGLWWSCPFHEDRNPSFHVSAERGRWKCFAGCGSGDAMDLVRRIEGLSFEEGKQRLASMFSLEGRDDGAPAARAPLEPRHKARCKPPAVDPPKALALRQWAMRTTLDAVERLWSPEGREALDYLRWRGLTDATIGLARLGFAPSLALPAKDGDWRPYRASGIVIPWFDGDRLALLKVRRLDHRKPKYIEAFRDRPAMFAPFGVRPGFPLILVEGEFDALLLDQELGRVADVATVGSASTKPSPKALRFAREAPALFLAHDADESGDRAARRWPKRGVRVRPEGGKDWTEIRAGGFGRIAYAWGRWLPLGSPPRPEDFADASLYRQAPDERDIIEAMEERAAIQEADGIEVVEAGPGMEANSGIIGIMRRGMEPETDLRPIGPSLPQGGFEPEADDEAARLALVTKGETIEEAETDPRTIDRIMSAAGFVRVDPSELDAFAEFDPPAVDRPETTERPSPLRREDRAGVELMEPTLF